MRSKRRVANGAILSAAILSYALNVLPADPSQRVAPNLSPGSPSGSAPDDAPDVARASDELPVNVALFAGAGLLLLYGLAVGIGLLGGDIAPDGAYLWMMPVPLALTACYAFGYARRAGALVRDSGLIVSALGWLACALCLLCLHGAARAALASGLRLDQMTPSPLAWFMAALAILGIGAGALLSLRHWQRYG